jgi:DNA replication protein DnaC
MAKPRMDLSAFVGKLLEEQLIHELATARFVAQREDALFLGPPGTGKSHLARPSAVR